MSNELPGWPAPKAASPPPPPPPRGQTATPPPPPPSPYGFTTPGYPTIGPGMPAAFAPGKPPRPATPVAGWLMIAGAVLTAIGCFLPWLTIEGSFGDVSFNGFDDLGPLDDEPALGGAFLFFGLVMLGFGIATLLAKRILAIMIIGIVVASISMLGAAGKFSDYNDTFVDGGPIGVELGAGLPVVAVGSAVALAGAIVGCAKRRRWPTI